MMTDFWTAKQKQDIVFFNEHVEEWASDPLYRRKFVVIADRQLRGFYDEFATAIEFAAVTFGGGCFIIQQILSDDN